MMLQNMQTKETEDGKRGQALYDKLMHYCKKGIKDLEDSIAAAKARIEAFESASKEDFGKKAQTGQALKEHEASCDMAKQAMQEATGIREKKQGHTPGSRHTARRTWPRWSPRASAG